jgi:hypothetical protein
LISGKKLVKRKEEKKMSIKFNTLWLGACLALMSSMIAPAIADEWNKETKIEFSGPVQVPGKVLEAGKYVFKLLDSDSDRNVVEIFSEDSSGNQKLVTTVLAISAYRTKTPDEPIVQFEERPAGSPEAVHTWFYPGDNTGWEFVYRKGETLETSANITPTSTTTAAPAPSVATTDSPSLPPAPQVQEETPAPEAHAVEEETIVAQNNALVPPPPEDTDGQNSADRILPQTGGYSGLELMTGLFMLGGGIAAVFASRCTSLN